MTVRLPLLSLSFLALVVLTFAARGADSSECPGGNRLRGIRPLAQAHVAGDLRTVCDGTIAPEGTVWNARIAAVLRDERASLTFDLGAVVNVRGIALQADGNDEYGISVSQDGVRFEDLWVAPPLPVHGLRLRSLRLSGVPVRFVRLAHPRGDGLYSVSELQVYCELPPEWPPSLPVAPGDFPRAESLLLTERLIGFYRLALATAAVIALFGEYAGWFGRSPAGRRVYRGTLIALAALSAAAYANFGRFHHSNRIHYWEFFHYYLGSKYFGELRYTRLYDCVAAAEAEEGRRADVESRKIRSLETNEILPDSRAAVARGAECRDRFGPARWQEFSRDVRFFRERVSPQTWRGMQLDHGYNATPAWTLLARALSDRGGATVETLRHLALLDAVLIVASLALVYRAFGVEIFCLALVFFGTNFPSRFWWTGGAFLRQDWLFAATAGVCLLRRGAPAAAGAFLAWSAASRVFPVLLMFGLVVRWVAALVLGRRTDGAERRCLAAFAATLAVLIVASSVAFGVRVHVETFANLRKHAQTPLTNHVGLPTLLSWSAADAARFRRSDDGPDPFERWKELRRRAFERRRPLFAGLLLVFYAVLARAALREPAWAAVALGSLAIPPTVELTCYYYSFQMLATTLAARWRPAGGWLLFLCVTNAFLPFVLDWDDELYVAISATSALFSFVLAARFAARTEPQVRSGE